LRCRPAESAAAHREEEEKMATPTYRVSATSTDDYDEVRGAGWLMFAVAMLGLAGIWSVIDGILAISRSHVYTTTGTHYVFSDLRTWGWIVLVLGVVVIVAAWAIFTGSEFARWFGITAAGLNAIGQLGFIPAYPFWALTMFAVDILVIYALTAYAGHRLRET
jgi:uncharacterized membrane protein YdbT with pleckstrin-like domain